jgi:hypothetical protein
MMLFRYDADAKRVWLLERRVHHGLVGVICAALGLLLMVHDRRDARVWFRDGQVSGGRRRDC